MNSYKRIVSYMYQYQMEEKQENVGYAKIEQRGEQCRIFVQVRTRCSNKKQRIYFFSQKSGEIETIPMGRMAEVNGGMCFKAVTESNNLFQSGKTLEGVDGILIYEENSAYFATIWKNERFRIGQWNGDNITTSQNKHEEQESKEKQYMQEEVKTEKNEMENAQKTETERNKNTKLEKETEATLETDTVPEAENTSEVVEKGKDLEIQSVCNVCPFKEEKGDYGKKLLASYPAIMPFGSGDIVNCVRIELQDIGCLPMKYWHLAGNRFVLQGYYGYRHLLFVQNSSGTYLLGVPGIYNQRNKYCGRGYGFCKFCALEERELSEGVFGYWMLELSAGNR